MEWNAIFSHNAWPFDILWHGQTNRHNYIRLWQSLWHGSTLKAITQNQWIWYLRPLTSMVWLTSFLAKRHMWEVVDGDHSDSVTVDLCHKAQSWDRLCSCAISTISLTQWSHLLDCLQMTACFIITLTQENYHLTLQNDLAAGEKWADTWGVEFNASKCCYEHLPYKISHFYSLGNQVLQQVHQNPYLGVLLSDDHKWAPHIDKSIGKVSSTLGLLKRNLKHCLQHCNAIQSGQWASASNQPWQVFEEANFKEAYQAGDIQQLHCAEYHW